MGAFIMRWTILGFSSVYLWVHIVATFNLLVFRLNRVHYYQSRTTSQHASCSVLAKRAFAQSTTIYYCARYIEICMCLGLEIYLLLLHKERASFRSHSKQIKMNEIFCSARVHWPIIKSWFTASNEFLKRHRWWVMMWPKKIHFFAWWWKKWKQAAPKKNRRHK